MTIEELEIGKVYYVSDNDIDIKTSPKILLLAKEKNHYVFMVIDLGVATKRVKGEIYWKELNSLLPFNGFLMEYKCIS